MLHLLSYVGRRSFRDLLQLYEATCAEGDVVLYNGAKSFAPSKLLAELPTEILDLTISEWKDDGPNAKGCRITIADESDGKSSPLNWTISWSENRHGWSYDAWSGKGISHYFVPPSWLPNLPEYFQGDLISLCKLKSYDVNEPFSVSSNARQCKLCLKILPKLSPKITRHRSDADRSSCIHETRWITANLKGILIVALVVILAGVGLSLLLHSSPGDSSRVTRQGNHLQNKFEQSGTTASSENSSSPYTTFPTEFRTWTDIQGCKIQARILIYDFPDRRLKLERKDGIIFEDFDIARLSPEDQIYLDSISSAVKK